MKRCHGVVCIAWQNLENQDHKERSRWVSQRREDKWQQGAGHMLEAEYERSVEASNLGCQKFFGKPSVTVSNLQQWLRWGEV
jgi:hypothetical protein